MAEPVCPGWTTKDCWIASKDLPLVSGIHTARMIVVVSDKDPKRKYAPNAERARKIGVANATSQLVNYLE